LSIRREIGKEEISKLFKGGESKRGSIVKRKTERADTANRKGRRIIGLRSERVTRGTWTITG